VTQSNQGRRVAVQRLQPLISEQFQPAVVLELLDNQILVRFAVGRLDAVLARGPDLAAKQVGIAEHPFQMVDQPHSCVGLDS
jgi:hypothetical protein